MRKIIKAKQRFVRREYASLDAARAELADEPFKLELVDLKGTSDAEEDGEIMEVGAGALTAYDNIHAHTGERVWGDLCRGPHIPTTGYIPAFKITRSAAAYWRGDQRNAQLQRIYGTAWESQEAQDAYLERLAEAERRDHRRLGAELDLFSFPDEIGSGLAVFHPKGGIIRKELEDYSRQRHTEAGYQFVNTPHATKGELFQTSGHLDWYREGMFPAMHLDEERAEDGTVRRPGIDYYLKPMNCPMHNLIFRSRGRSYRELPLRLFEFGTVYRYEKSGVVHGLTRARGFTQDDAHIYCTREQMAGRDHLAADLRARPAARLRPRRLLPRALHPQPGEVHRHRRGVGGGHRRAARGRRRASGSTSWTTRAAPPSTPRRSACRPRTRSAGTGRCRRSRSTSCCPTASSSSTPRATGPGSARS